VMDDGMPDVVRQQMSMSRRNTVPV
jgi:hypothetical protein